MSSKGNYYQGLKYNLDDLLKSFGEKAYTDVMLGEIIGDVVKCFNSNESKLDLMKNSQYYINKLAEFHKVKFKKDDGSYYNKGISLTDFLMDVIPEQNTHSILFDILKRCIRFGKGDKSVDSEIQSMKYYIDELVKYYSGVEK